MKKDGCSWYRLRLFALQKEIEVLRAENARLVSQMVSGVQTRDRMMLDLILADAIRVPAAKEST
jgi:hypothetical protein